MPSEAPSGRPGTGGSSFGFRRATDWLAVAIVGALVFLIGIYTPATAWIRGPTAYGTDWVSVGVALVGGVLLGLGLSKWYDLRPGGPAERRRPPDRRDTSRASTLSSFEVYSPPADDRSASTKPKV